MFISYKINAKNSSIKIEVITVKSKYDNYYFWENIVKQDRHDNPFANDIISKESVFLHGIIINCYGGSYERWLHFPSIEALIGFLNYIFIPTAFLTLLTGEEGVLIANVSDLLDLMNKSDKCEKKELIPDMREFGIKLREFWNYDATTCIDKLKSFSANYNARWSEAYDIFSYFDIYESPNELGNYIVGAYENSGQVDISVLEQQLGVSKQEWLSICSQVYENKFMQRKFTEVLNNRINDML